mmetsp:Transcript_57067/g.177414  ORF Transcript_57067/g.177414 Transcript_57067/m.177414 type:complete len:270 (-) Transcript_57067:1021-1830(-)
MRKTKAHILKACKLNTTLTTRAGASRDEAALRARQPAAPPSGRWRGSCRPLCRHGPPGSCTSPGCRRRTGPGRRWWEPGTSRSPRAGRRGRSGAADRAPAKPGGHPAPGQGSCQTQPTRRGRSRTGRSQSCLAYTSPNPGTSRSRGRCNSCSCCGARRSAVLSNHGRSPLCRSRWFAPLCGFPFPCEHQGAHLPGSSLATQAPRGWRSVGRRTQGWPHTCSARRSSRSPCAASSACRRWWRPATPPASSPAAVGRQCSRLRSGLQLAAS